MTESTNKTPWATPLAIVVAGIMISGAILTKQPIESVAKISQGDQVAQVDGSQGDALDPALDQLVGLTKADHVRGNRNAPVVIIEFSDLDCPFCERFHNTMNQVVDHYGTNVAWVYRHFPLDSIHPHARTKAIASECIAAISGNDMFWEYIDLLFSSKPTVDRLTRLATDLGVSEDAFRACMEGGQLESIVQNHLDNGVATGGRGTPWSIVVAPSGALYPISGAQSFESVSAVIDRALAEVDLKQ